ncbi:MULTISPECIES: ribonuclease III [Cysteiniphilum]|uniref:ribonuclease III n=1 Tax=Cysteiniphilum TaxID=2056696 RepID=UPI00177B4822|nr:MULTISPECIES: ribonuclease III [Cysteiniphilum]
MTIDYTPLYRSIGYHFNNEALITQALTHRSKQKQHNERLEFLGDSILGFVIAEALYQKFPHEDEGSLSLLRMYLVRGKTLTDMAKHFDLGEYMSFGVGELKSGGHKRARLLEDAFEALIGAIYLDSDMLVVKERILHWFKDVLATLNVEEHTKDPKSRLQEYLQAEIQTHPIYSIIATEGLDHDQTFTVEVSLGSLEHSYRAKGKSRKQAEHNAAKEALKAIKAQDQQNKQNKQDQ